MAIEFRALLRLRVIICYDLLPGESDIRSTLVVGPQGIKKSVACITATLCRDASSWYSNANESQAVPSGMYMVVQEEQLPHEQGSRSRTEDQAALSSMKQTMVALKNNRTKDICWSPQGTR